ncbi:MAG: cellobiose phosphorylase [Chloroflexi bacterium HGW-Chloroflexi-10]|nr:MAG: cellobiose phosphorylase [Chloroflexi bacterium HGW-Chloroflexi-10]
MAIQATSNDSQQPGWKFIDDQGAFRLQDPQHVSYLYFPLVNEGGVMSSITPDGHGDLKTSQNTFLNQPVSVEDLHSSRQSRNFWCHFANGQVWSALGASAAQIAQRWAADAAEQVQLEAGFLWHKAVRTHSALGIRAVVTSFVPSGTDPLEIFRVCLENIGSTPLTFTPTAALPVFARSADNLRDHRHVTALLHRLTCLSQGVVVQPSLSFDERGHQPNEMRYAVFGFGGDGQLPIGFFPLVEGFLGEGGSYDWPRAVVENQAPTHQAGAHIAGYEAIGALRFRDVTLLPGESVTYICVQTILSPTGSLESICEAYGQADKVEAALQKTKTFWQEKVETLTFQTGSRRNDLWLHWVALQPVLRRMFGNSFLPFHDYGRGGRGWRDLWQDALALLLMESSTVGETLYENYAGVRLDGSNATIIGSKPGEFKADRNNIARVWMDHGAWPLITTRLYLERSGDLPFLLREQHYFKDQHIYRAGCLDANWQTEMGSFQRTTSGEIYRGSILEHLLVQHLVQFFNVGEHNLLRLEGADWNDGMDMAAERGESVAFSALYAGNLHYLAGLLRTLDAHATTQINLAAELTTLLDDPHQPIDYDSQPAKVQRLQAYFEQCRHIISGEKVSINTLELAADVQRKADWLTEKIRTQEWLENENGQGWFNGYYDNHGRQVEGVRDGRVYMTLTGQVFSLMCGVATPAQAEAMIRAVRTWLWDKSLGGPRLNTDFDAVRLDLGRCFGFAYGHKENGAMFTHMAVMYAYALYRRGFIQEGYSVLDSIYRHVQNFGVARMLPGLPEYVEPGGRGVYPFLTGSASWYLFTLLTESFGVKGCLGDLVLEPKLTLAQFDESGKAAVSTEFAGKRLKIVYLNRQRLEYGKYQVTACHFGGKIFSLEADMRIRIPRSILQSLSSANETMLEVYLETQTA